jgi:hypothetical protein
VNADAQLPKSTQSGLSLPDETTRSRRRWLLPTQHAFRPKIERRITQPIFRPKIAGGSMAFERTVSNQPSPIGLSGRPMHRAFRGLLGDAATPQLDYRILEAGRVVLKASLISASVNYGISRRRYFYLVKYSG